MSRRAEKFCEALKRCTETLLLFTFILSLEESMNRRFEESKNRTIEESGNFCDTTLNKRVQN